MINRYLLENHNSTLFSDIAGDNISDLYHKNQQFIKDFDDGKIEPIIITEEYKRLLTPNLQFLNNLDENRNLYYDVKRRKDRNILLEQIYSTISYLLITSGLRMNELFINTFKIMDDVVEYNVSKNIRKTRGTFKPYKVDSEIWISTLSNLLYIFENTIDERFIKTMNKNINSFIQSYYPSVKTSHKLRSIYRQLTGSNLNHKNDNSNKYYDVVALENVEEESVEDAVVEEESVDGKDEIIEELRLKIQELEEKLTEKKKPLKKKRCETCDVEILQKNFNTHLRSKKHLKNN